MKRVKELAQENSKPIWQHFTANKPAKTRVSRKLSTRKHARTIRMANNPLTNVYIRMNKKRSLSRVIKTTTRQPVETRQYLRWRNRSLRTDLEMYRSKYYNSIE
jgi:hypothetical protein